MKNPLFTSSNHFKYGWSGKVFDSVVPINDNPLEVSFGRPRRFVKNFREECILAAQEIRKDIDRDLFVSLSGGCDSEIVCRAFLEAKISFTPVIFEFEENLNQHDIEFAFSFCKEKGLVPMVVPVRIREYFRGDNEKWSNRYRVAASNVLVSWMWDHFFEACPDGYIVGGDGYNRFYSSRVNSDQMGYFVEVGHLAQYMYLMEKERWGCPDFFCYTPELMASFIFDADVKHWVKWGRFLKFTSLDWFKNYILSKHWPELEPRFKFTGTERVKEENLKQRLELLENNKKHFQELEWTYDAIEGYFKGECSGKATAIHRTITDWSFDDK